MNNLIYGTVAHHTDMVSRHIRSFGYDLIWRAGVDDRFIGKDIRQQFRINELNDWRRVTRIQISITLSNLWS